MIGSYHFNNYGYLGSLFSDLGCPNKIYRERGFNIKEWNILSDSSDNIQIILKKNEYSTKKERAFDIVELFGDLFKKKTLEDAKRIITDVSLNKSPTNIAIASLYISSGNNNEGINFESGFKDIINRTKKYSKRKKSSYYNTIVFKSKIKKLAEEIKDELYDEKINLLRKLEGI